MSVEFRVRDAIDWTGGELLRGEAFTTLPPDPPLVGTAADPVVEAPTSGEPAAPAP